MRRIGLRTVQLFSNKALTGATFAAGFLLIILITGYGFPPSAHAVHPPNSVATVAYANNFYTSNLSQTLVNDTLGPGSSATNTLKTDIVLHNAVDVFAWQVKISYAASKLNVRSFTLGPAWVTGNLYFHIDNVAGTALAGMTFTDPPSAVTDDGPLVMFSVNWLVIDEGASNIHLVTETEDPTFGTKILDTNQRTEQYDTEDGFVSTVGGDVLPDPEFRTSQNLAMEGVPEVFDASASMNLDTLAWDFGDGTIDSGVMVSHSYDSACNPVLRPRFVDDSGCYRVFLIGANAAGSATSTKVIIVQFPLAPDFTFTTPVTPGKPVTFVATATGGTSPYTFTWDVGQDGTVDGSGDTFAYTFQIKSPAVITIELTASDSVGNTATVSQVVRIDPLPLRSAATCDDTTLSKPVNCHATATGGTPPYSFAWDVRRDGIIDAAGETVTLLLASPGWIKLIVTDANGERALVDVPIIVADFTFIPADPTAGKPVTFSVTRVEGGSPPYAFRWDLGKDGVVDGTGTAFTTRFPVKGTFSMDLVVTDASGASGHLNKIISVVAQMLQVVATCSNNFTDQPINCSAYATGGTPPYLLEWDVGNDGTVDGTGQSLMMTFPAAGSYSIDVIVRDANGAVASMGLTAAVGPPLEIHGMVWDDENGNGAKEELELGLPGMDVCIFGLGRCSPTDSDGRYSFTDLPPDTYEVYVLVQTFDRINTTSLSRSVVVAGEASFNVNFGSRAATPPPSDVQVASALRTTSNGTPIQERLSTPLVIKKTETACVPVQPPTVTLTWPPWLSDTKRTKLMVNAGGNVWQADFSPPFPRGIATVTLEVDCPPDTASYPGDSASISVEDESRIGNVIFLGIESCCAAALNPPPIGLSGRVLDACNGRPIGGATVTLTGLTFDSNPAAMNMTTGADGSFSWGSAWGTYKVHAQRDPYLTSADVIVTVPWAAFGLDIILARTAACTAPPMANAGPDFQIEGNSVAGATVRLDGTRSSNADGGTLSYTWSGDCGTATGPTPTVFCPLGTNMLTLLVNDGWADSEPDTLMVTVVDTTSPVINASRTPLENPTGWDNQTVRVDFQCSDIVSESVSVSAPVVLTGDGWGQTATGSCADEAGNTATATVTGINIDKTIPSITSPQHGQTFLLRQTVFADAKCTDGLSGVNTCIMPTLPLDSNTVGPHSYVVTSTDYAGNTAMLIVHYDVRYVFVQVSPQPPATRFQVGRTIAVRFQLTDALGNCVPSAGAQLWVDSPANPGKSSGSANSENYFRYDSTSNQYVFNLSTSGLATGSHTIFVTLDDGTVHTTTVTLTA